MKKTRVFFATLALVLAPMNAMAQDKGGTQPKQPQPVCVPADVSELPSDSPEKFMETVAKALGRSFTCMKCTNGTQIKFACTMGCSSDRTC